MSEHRYQSRHKTENTRHASLRRIYPSGRNKPELSTFKAIEKGYFSQIKGINAAVDVCNADFLYKAIDMADFDRLKPPLTLELCPKDCAHPFNPSGRFWADGLLALWDQHDLLQPLSRTAREARPQTKQKYPHHCLATKTQITY